MLAERRLRGEQASLDAIVDDTERSYDRFERERRLNNQQQGDVAKISTLADLVSLLLQSIPLSLSLKNKIRHQPFGFYEIQTQIYQGISKRQTIYISF